MKFSDKEIARQKQRIEDFKVDPERDESDVKKQGEVLQEYVAGQMDEANRLKKAIAVLQEVLVVLCKRLVHLYCLIKQIDQRCCEY